MPALAVGSGRLIAGGGGGGGEPVASNSFQLVTTARPTALHDRHVTYSTGLKVLQMVAVHVFQQFASHIMEEEGQTMRTDY